MDKQDALRRIKKCLALANSSEPHEAARALSQAQALMQRFNIDHPELLASGVQTAQANSRASSRPPGYEAGLAVLVADAYGCDVLFMEGYAFVGIRGSYHFVGVGAAAEVASYTYTVLARKLKQARAEYTALRLKRHRRNKVAAADAFCDGWLVAVSSEIQAAARSAQDDAAVQAWRQLHAGDPRQVATTSRKPTGKKARVVNHLFHGYREGSKVKVRQGLDGAAATPRLGMELSP